jgi:hypothetical protein
MLLWEDEVHEEMSIVKKLELEFTEILRMEPLGKAELELYKFR